MKKLLLTVTLVVAGFTQNAKAEQWNIAATDLWSNSGTQETLPLAAQATFDPRFGYVVRPAYVTRFIVRVGPGSVQRGCVPASSTAGAIVFTGVLSTQPFLQPTTLVGQPTQSGARPGFWNYEFSVNGDLGAPVQAIQPAFQRTQFPVQCSYDILWRSQVAVPAAAPAGTPQARAAAAPAAAPKAEDLEHREIKVELKTAPTQH